MNITVFTLDDNDINDKILTFNKEEGSPIGTWKMSNEPTHVPFKANKVV